MNLNNISKPIAIFLVGVPTSGKSTFIKTFSQKYPDISFTVLSTDDIIEREAAKVGSNYTKSFSDLIKPATAEFNATFEDSVKNKQNIIIDRTNITVKGRKSFIQKLNGYHKIAIVFQVPNDELLKRLKNREKETGKYIPYNVVNDMLSRFEYPTEDEGFNSIIKV